MKTIKLFAAFALAFQLANAQQPGDLDPTFGTNGVAQTVIADNQSWEADLVSSVVSLSNGKCLAVGSSRLGSTRRVAYVCYNADGTLDSSFGDNGILLVLPSADLQNYGMDAVELPDGTIYSCGHMFSVATYETWPFLVKIKNGQLDTSFGSNGYLIIDIVNALGERMVVQPDGKIVVGGYLEDNILAMRFNPDGSLDNTFGENGLSKIVIEGSEDASFVKDLILQPDGKILLGGFYSTDATYKWAIVRLGANGKLDTTFGEGGIKKMSVGYGHDFVQGIGLQSDGKIVVAGHSWDANLPTLRYSAAVVRLNADGSQDSTFGSDGIFRKNFTAEGCSYVTDLAVSSEDKIYVACSPQEFTVYDLGIFSLDKDGNPNATFGDDGYTSTDLEGKEDQSKALAIQSDGKLLMGVVSYGPNGSPFGVVRYISDIVISSNAIVTTEQTFVAYPNPVKDVLNIEFDGNFSIQIFDMAGRMVLTSENIRTIDVKALAAGNYVIKLTSGDKAYTDRFVKL
ncbi:T9SS type A sorting domain-containing protein [Porphyromonas loveana]|uniref:Putative delta-60 repeat protein/predicted secreted protein (Por secretion system target) n=1 Tax=Porphyromonas loveana TaxID=1884669 RepID=A0A2U1FPJ6_9PORP|nr:T9SS type A sorting domain-containing protein [Porphyromonas loveana]PVZ13990.1 putative delta-60 repeat protein/predicted secreted protein (Por secretion system target) [Porphyromonas loveana]